MKADATIVDAHHPLTQARATRTRVPIADVRMGKRVAGHGCRPARSAGNLPPWRRCGRLQPTRRRPCGACSPLRRGLWQSHGRSGQLDAVRRCGRGFLLSLDRLDVAVASLVRGGIAKEVVAHCLAARGCLYRAAPPKGSGRRLRDCADKGLGRYVMATPASARRRRRSWRPGWRRTGTGGTCPRAATWLACVPPRGR